MRLAASCFFLVGMASAAHAAGPVVLKASRMFDPKSERLITSGIEVVVTGPVSS